MRQRILHRTIGILGLCEGGSSRGRACVPEAYVLSRARRILSAEQKKSREISAHEENDGRNHRRDRKILHMIRIRGK